MSESKSERPKNDGPAEAHSSRWPRPSHADWATRWRRSEPFRRRVSLGAFSATLGALIVALADAAWAQRAQGSAAGLLASGAAFGLLAPWAALVGVVLGVVSWLVHPRAEPTLRRLLAQLRDAGAGRPADMAAFAPLAALGLFLWATFGAQLARALLATEVDPMNAGVVVALGSLGLGLTIAVLVLALTPLLRQRLAIWRARVSGCVNPVATLGVSLGIIALLVVYGMFRGSVSGEGGLLGIYGVFRRQELDLRFVGAMLVLGLFAYLLPARMGRVRQHQAWIGVLLPLGLTVYAARELDRAADLSALFERHAPVSARTLALWRALADRDDDGAAATFGGGDCDDRDAGVHPSADDLPDNGRDEDCSGSDLSLAAVQAAQEAQEATTPKASYALPEHGNVVLITIDTLRFDVGYMGYPRPITPNLDALARRSVIFENAYALASYTGKSVGPMLIGKYPSETHRNWGHFNIFGKEDTFVAERLKRAGVHTVSVQGHRYFGNYGGLDRGFDVVDLSAAPPEGTKWATDTTVTSDKLTDAAIAMLDKKPEGRPFFLWVHYLDPHADYIVHEGVESFGKGARDLYDGEVLFTDGHIGRLLDHIAAQPFAKSTSIIVTSDHGEAFGEHGMWRHGVELWDVVVKVPLVVHVPGAKPRRIAARRSLIDLTPTILELMGQPIPEGKGGHDFVSGRSLLGDVFLPEGKEAPARDILIDMPAGPYNDARMAFIHGDRKLVLVGGRKELYDLGADPGEEKNLWPEGRDAIEAAYAAMKARLKEVIVEGKRKG
jgi:arylsulfatase A-like enzyme